MEKGFFLFYSLYSNIIYYIILYILRNSTPPKTATPHFRGDVANLGSWYMRISSFCEFELFQLAECNLGVKAFTRALGRAFLS